MKLSPKEQKIILWLLEVAIPIASAVKSPEEYEIMENLKRRLQQESQNDPD